MQILVGARQTGKTTAVVQALENITTPHRFVSADDPALTSGEWLRNEGEALRMENRHKTEPRSRAARGVEQGGATGGANIMAAMRDNGDQ